ncbi:uncharacterized protein [Oscarella lobularis]|uniref:uncharacterized protein isoform X1 n=1 Tax=Oscarella lobularis TaxID=121494 RepID=UPI003313D22F
MIAIRVVFLLVFIRSFSSANFADGDNGVDRMYGDLPGMPVTLHSTDKPSVCAQMCEKNAQCVCWAYCKANCSGGNDNSKPLCYLKGTLMKQNANPCRVSGVKNATLLPFTYKPLSLVAIQPQGWLKNQLKIQADGLSGHLSKFWVDVANSSWIGGKGDTFVHQETPYWLNGFVPLAFQLESDNPELLAQVHKYLDYILSHQSADGWLGPEDEKDGNMYWSKFPMLFALLQYYEGNSSDSRIIPAIMKFLHVAHQKMFQVPLGGWSAARWQDLAVSCHWLIEYGSTGEEQFLWDVAELASQQGFDWKSYYAGDDFPTQAATRMDMYNHGVNVGQSLKSGAIWYRQSKNETDRNSSYQRVERLYKYHGLASGIFAADEHLAGKMPSRGTELCAVVETMFSLEMIFAVTGDPMFAELAEKICYNSLPATLTPDMWAHQYLQQTNEANAVHLDSHVWASDGPDSILYGLEPNYGCCTGNFNQGWPKYVSHMFFSTLNNELVIGMYAPATVRHTMNNKNGDVVDVSVDTEYPWDGNVTIKTWTVSSSAYNVHLRIPSWAGGSTVAVNRSEPKTVQAGTITPVSCTGNTTISLQLAMKMRIERRYNNAAAVYKGPLLYALEIGENYTVLRNYSFESKDYQILNATVWNYGLWLDDDSNPEKYLEYSYRGFQSNAPPFSVAGSPAMIKAKGRVLPFWGYDRGSAAAPPTSPVNVSSTEPMDDITLLPFGATELRIGELPTLRPNAGFTVIRD